MLTCVFKGQDTTEGSCQQRNNTQFVLELLVWKVTECEVARRCVKRIRDSRVDMDI